MSLKMLLRANSERHMNRNYSARPTLENIQSPNLSNGEALLKAITCSNGASERPRVTNNNNNSNTTSSSSAYSTNSDIVSGYVDMNDTSRDESVVSPVRRSESIEMSEEAEKERLSEREDKEEEEEEEEEEEIERVHAKAVPTLSLCNSKTAPNYKKVLYIHDNDDEKACSSSKTNYIKTSETIIKSISSGSNCRIIQCKVSEVKKSKGRVFKNYHVVIIMLRSSYASAVLKQVARHCERQCLIIVIHGAATHGSKHRNNFLRLGANVVTNDQQALVKILQAVSSQGQSFVDSQKVDHDHTNINTNSNVNVNANVNVNVNVNANVNTNVNANGSVATKFYTCGYCGMEHLSDKELFVHLPLYHSNQGHISNDDDNDDDSNNNGNDNDDDGVNSHPSRADDNANNKHAKTHSHANADSRGTRAHRCPMCHGEFISKKKLVETKDGIHEKKLTKSERESNGHVDMTAGEHTEILTRSHVHVILQDPEGCRFLLVQVVSDKCQHEYDLPNARVQIDETLTEAAEKCVAKQAGIDIDIKGIIEIRHIVNQFGKHNLRNDFHEMHFYFYAEYTKSVLYFLFNK
ncbi:hypothetical protein RFI_19934 [Reticulomyxa filosa]|uniref:Uncharacterized protein n=1 Tax=Reticulomyxa filosa TaxID=46433 RepID=X6MUT9_RETFI|nr:hypothetical protein RFI_19934 [Reticulomyxa filosa]|eukprot:ETO17391.1 hypothetical protein RFI_19934 [Reticulomyxa filosa]